MNVKTKLLKSILFGMIFIILISCNTHECKNLNPIFNNYSSTDEVYKNELVTQLHRNGTTNLFFSFEGYKKMEDKEFIIVNIKGLDFCAKANLRVDDWSKIGMLRRNGGGYRGAELSGLRIEVMRDSSGTNFIFKGLAEIID